MINRNFGGRQELVQASTRLSRAYLVNVHVSMMIEGGAKLISIALTNAAARRRPRVTCALATVESLVRHLAADLKPACLQPPQGGVVDDTHRPAVRDDEYEHPRHIHARWGRAVALGRAQVRGIHILSMKMRSTGPPRAATSLYLYNGRAQKA
jgi:hypothetical protein